MTRSTSLRKPKQNHINNNIVKHNKRPLKIIGFFRPHLLEQLPEELLEKIFGYINVWHHRRIRCASRRFCDVMDNYILHQYKTEMVRSQRECPTGYRAVILTTIYESTKYYVNAGYESTFCGCLLAMFGYCFTQPYEPDIIAISRFLVHFFNVMEDILQQESKLFGNALYAVTLLHLLMKFPNCRISAITLEEREFSVMVELEGPWVGLMWSLGRTHCYPQRRSGLLAILAELLMASKQQQIFKRVFQSGEEDVFVFGNNGAGDRSMPLTRFTLFSKGSKYVCELLTACYRGEAFQPNNWSQKIKEKFTVQLEIDCKESAKWGCRQSQKLSIGPEN